MYAAVLAILSCAGAWLTWRSHPVYSPTATFRVLGEVILLIIASGCIIALTVMAIQHQPVAIAASALFVVIVGVTLAMVFSITALTTPKAAKLHTELPSGATVINLRRRKVVHWVKVGAVFAAICAAACLIPGATRWIAATVLGMTVLLACILVPTMWIMARRFDRSATALTLHPWLHWSYAAAEWQSWSETRVARLEAQPGNYTFKRNWGRIWPIAGGVLVGALILTPGALPWRIAYAAFCCALIFAWIEIAAWDAKRAPTKLRAALAHAAPDVYFGEDGLLCDDRFFTWLGTDVYLTTASLDERAPRSLLFQFEKVMPNPYGSPNTVHSSQSVLIPAAVGADDLDVLRKALAARCPKAALSF
jgi:hypothetical protein